MTDFRQNMSAMKFVLDLVTCVEHESSIHKATVAVFLGMQRAFDTFCHYHVIEQLQRLEVGDRLISWMSDFLPDWSVYA